MPENKNILWTENISNTVNNIQWWFMVFQKVLRMIYWGIGVEQRGFTVWNFNNYERLT